MTPQELADTRGAEYGHPADNFACLLALWTAYEEAVMAKRDLQPVDMAAFNILQKLSRCVTSPHKLDNWADIAGYAECAGRVIARLDKA